MITQKQIDARDIYIKRLHSLGIKGAFIAFDELRQMQRAIADADKEAAETKDEMLDVLIESYIWHKAQFEDNDGCPFDCDSEMEHECHDCIHVKFCDYKSIIERATGLTIDEAIKAWEERNK